MNETMMTSLLIQLADLGVTGIKIKYEGSGDSGCIEDVLYTTDKLSENEEDAFDAVKSLEPWAKDVKDLKKLHSGLASDIENFAEEKILNDVEDWWNNEGGYGEMCILVPSGKYQVENNIRITTIEDYIHEGSLIDKSLD
jgi:hypothetical protein